MDLEPYRLLYAYNRWANARVLDHAEKLTPEQLLAPNTRSFGSVRDTLVHLVENEFFWSGLIWPGKAIDIDWKPFEFDPNDYPDVAAIRARWTEIESDLAAFIDELTPDGENSPERIVVWTDNGKMFRRPLWPELLSVAMHATQHRSEIAVMLTEYGCSPGDLDLSFELLRSLPGSAG
ncbi:MAG TPA: DinB family protein [Nitrolancea sp.]